MNKIIGCDVSKETIGVYNLYTQKKATIKNNFKEIEALKEGLDDDYVFVYEATGVYSSTLQKTCNYLNMKHLLIHPSDSSRLFKSLFGHNKTDELDAQALAKLAAMLLSQTDEMMCKNKFIKPSSNDTARMRSLMSEIYYHKNEIVRKKNHIEKLSNDAFCDPGCIERHTKDIKSIQDTIKELEDKVLEMFERLRLLEKYKCLQTIPGIGTSVVIEMTVFFSTISEKGLTQKDQKKMLAYSGLNPVQQQSGISINGSGLSKRGDKHIRKAIHLSAIQRQKRYKNEKYEQTALGKFTKRMIDHFSSPSRKRGKSIACAVAHKMLSIGRSMFHTEIEYNFSL